MSLYQSCIWKVVTLLKTGYWSNSSRFSPDSNPFSFLPPEVVDEITATIFRISSPNGIKVADLYYLLTSGRLERLVIEEVLMRNDDLISILMSLSVACQNLKSLTFKNVRFTDPYSPNVRVFKPGNALACLLEISPQVEFLESCIEFDLEVLNKCEKLKFLDVNFFSQKPVCRILIKDGYFEPNYCLKSLTVLEDYRHPISFCNIVPILQYCKELTYIKADISRCLELLHCEELYDGSLSTQYKLQRCYLGTPFVDNGAVSSVAVHIATLTCPDMRDIDVLINDHEAVIALGDFKNLNSLLIQWEQPNGGNFQCGVQFLLERIGANLKNLNLLNFFYVDFAVIAKNCTDLDTLKVELFSETHCCERPTECFQRLTNLCIEFLDTDLVCHEETIIMILSHCKQLKYLRMDGAKNLNDHSLNKILAKNDFPNLIDAFILNCSLTDVGMRKLVSSVRSLEFFQFSSSLLEFDEAANIVHEVNPQVLLVFDDQG